MFIMVVSCNLQNAIGAIDGCHIHCIPPVENREVWRNKKGFSSQNILAAVDFNGRFQYVCTSWEGSAHDSRVLRSVLDGPNADFPRPQNGKVVCR